MSVRGGGADETGVILSRLIKAMHGSIMIEVIMILIDEDMASFRLLSRRLKVNHKRLRSNLRPLLTYGIIEEVQIKVADGRMYRAYRLEEGTRRVLQRIFKESP